LIETKTERGWKGNRKRVIERAGNTNQKGKLSAVNLLIRVTSFIKKKIIFSVSKAADLN